MYPVPKKLEAEIEQIFASSDPYETVSSLADDEVLIGLVTEFAESKRTYCAARVISKGITSLPDTVTNAWSAAYLVPPSWPNPVIGEGATDKSAEDYRSRFVPAFALTVAGGSEVLADSQRAFFFHMTDEATGIDVQLHKNSAEGDDPYMLSDSKGNLISTLEETAVVNILASLAGEEVEDFRQLDHSEQCMVLIKIIGDKYGMSREEYRITAGGLTPTKEEAKAKAATEIYGAVIYAHDERPTGSSVSFLVERLLKYPGLDSDVTFRMRASYFAVSEEDGSLPAQRPYLSKTVASPSGYEITNVDLEEHMLGTTRGLRIDDDTLEPITDTLQEVVASVVDGLGVKS